MAKQQENSKTFKRLCADYVLNMLGQDERLQFEEMLDEATDEQREIYQKMRTKGNELMFSDRDDPSPERMREQLIQEVEEGEVRESADQEKDEPNESAEVQVEESVGDESPAVSMGIIVSVVLGFICLSLIFYSFSLRSEIGSQKEIIAGQEQQIKDLGNEITQLREMLGVLDSRQLYVVTMLGMEASPFSYGNVIWDAQHKNVLVQVAELPVPAAGEQYQLWGIFDNEAISIRSFSVDDEGNALFMVENLVDTGQDEGFSFAVSLEPEGAGDQPNGEMYLMGSFEE